MSKRIKLIFVISMLCFCLAFLVVSIYASVTLVFSVTSSLNYDGPSARDYINWVNNTDTSDVEDGYWTLTMGEYEGTPLVWRMVLKEEENNKVSSVVGYTQDMELSGSYYFLLATYIEDVFECSFENWYFDIGISTTSRLDQYGSNVNANDYAVSNIREYLTGVNVYRGYTRSGSYDNGYTYIPSTDNITGQTEQENFITKFNIDSSPVYSMIEGRSLSDLYSRMAFGPAGNSVDFDTDVKNGVEELVGIDPDTTNDKLWLLSYYEAYKITGSNAADSGARSWGDTYWLRSPSSYSDVVSWVEGSGQVNAMNYVHLTFCARPAFKISF